MPVYTTSGGVLTFLPSNLADDYFDLIHNAAAATFPKIALNVILKNNDEVSEFIFDGNEGNTGISASNLGEVIILTGMKITEESYNFMHDAAANINGTQVYFRPDGSSSFSGRLVSNMPGATNTIVKSVPNASEWVTVWHHINASQDSCVVSFDETQSDGNRLLVQDPNVKSEQYIRSNTGRFIKIKYTAAPSAILYIDDNAA